MNSNKRLLAGGALGCYSIFSGFARSGIHAPYRCISMTLERAGPYHVGRWFRFQSLSMHTLKGGRVERVMTVIPCLFLLFSFWDPNSRADSLGTQNMHLVSPKRVSAEIYWTTHSIAFHQTLYLTITISMVQSTARFRHLPPHCPRLRHLWWLILALDSAALKTLSLAALVSLCESSSFFFFFFKCSKGKKKRDYLLKRRRRRRKLCVPGARFWATAALTQSMR